MNVIKQLVLVFTLLISITKAEVSDFGTRGSKWFGGSFSYSSIGVAGGDSRTNLFQASPITRFFPTDFLMIGPSFSWTGMFMENSNLNQFGFGFDVGALFNAKGVMPYFHLSPSYNLTSYHYKYESYYYDESGGSNTHGFSLPIGIGIIIPVGDIIALQFEPSINFVFIEDETINAFSISLGICGIGKNTAISFLQGFSAIKNQFLMQFF